MSCICKVVLESGLKATEYDSSQLEPGSQIKRDMAFDQSHQHLYVLTNSRVRMRLLICLKVYRATSLRAMDSSKCVAVRKSEIRCKCYVFLLTMYEHFYSSVSCSCIGVNELACHEFR